MWGYFSQFTLNDYSRTLWATFLINGYSEHRIPLLHSIGATYSAATNSVSTVIILWSNPSTSSQTLAELSQNLTYIRIASISVIRQPSTSLNLQFYLHKLILTRAVLVYDEDVDPNIESINFAFSVWKSNPDRLVGFFARADGGHRAKEIARDCSCDWV
ncbi:PREDICTED: glycosyltransferase family protein 64 C3-like [Ipomoea nil]|uniref:glycosyltransferase family protein 64 C3-like n=1 Tax=Ipomoea nil TaxID=35883 RepID=UPI00090090A7|nr:PREDICTED: glycosyltransferase family protein 64 C3-like [Ipomoea nil]